MILLTGGTGFFGRNFLATFKNGAVKVVTRNDSKSLYDYYLLSEGINSQSNWNGAFEGVDVVIHAAGIAHVKKPISIENYRDVNTFGTLRLAREAEKNGVKRFIFLSTIGVLGIQNISPFRYFDGENPVDNYSLSKFEAEKELMNIAKNSDMDVVIIRPPLIYGKNAPGNFGTLLKVAEKNLPLPLGAINNQRSFVAIDNLIDLIITCIDHPNAANQTFLVSDDEDISTSNMLKKLILAADKVPRLIPVPVSVLKFAASIIGKKTVVERFSSSLTVDIEHTKETLNWKPPITLDEGILRCFK